MPLRHVHGSSPASSAVLFFRKRPQPPARVEWRYPPARFGSSSLTEHYHLGSHRGGPSSYQVNDAYAVHDQMLWLPLGLAYAK